MNREIIEDIRREIVVKAYEHNLGHVASSLSCLEIIAILLDEFMHDDDLFVLSKGHGCYAYHAILQRLRRLNTDWWKLPGCTHIPFSTGSLGHGLPLAVGYAFARPKSRVWCLLGDGEMQEGSVWEAICLTKTLQLNNLAILIDANQYMAMERADYWTVLYDRIKMFGRCPRIFNGHQTAEIRQAFREFNFNPVFDTVIFMTVKGHGVKEMENRAEWHYRVPTKEMYDAFQKRKTAKMDVGE